MPEIVDGWVLTRTVPRFVARQRIIHTDDHSITYRYESALSHEDLLKRLDWRRRYEAGRERR